jgi:putative FmdB family regulatory protein
MPAYDYKCDSCGHVFEVTKKISDPHPTECPDCKCGPVQRYHGAADQHVVYKGKGWMKTDGKY